MDTQPEDPDREDVRRVLAGDTAAFEHIVRRWQGPLVNMAYRFCRDPGRAEELAQDAFLRAFRFLGRWRQDAAFSTWLFALAINVYRSHLRRVRPREVPLEPYHQAEDPESTAGRIERESTGELVPSSDFTNRVMRTVHHEVERQEGLGLPWRHLGLGLATCALLTLAALVIGRPPAVGAAALARIGRSPELVTALTWIPTSLVGSYMMVWWSLRMAGYRR